MDLTCKKNARDYENTMYTNRPIDGEEGFKQWKRARKKIQQQRPKKCGLTKNMHVTDSPRDFELGREERFHLYQRTNNVEELNRMMPMMTMDVTLCKILYQCMHSISDLHEPERSYLKDWQSI